MKNILVIGNGFDIYHRLKTNYIDFVRFSKELIKEKTDSKERRLAISNSFMQCFINVASESQSWIDCEKEIEKIVTMMRKISYDRNVFAKNTHYIERDSTVLTSYEFELLKLMKKYYCKNEAAYRIAFKDIYFKTYDGIDKNLLMKTLRNDLDDLVKLFKFYLEKNVMNQSVTCLSKQIENINPDYVISFNYTNTYEWYGISRQDVCHIHGSVKDDNIVLGIRDIDEKDIDSIYFKKFFQRIQKHTDIIQWNKFGENHSLSDTMRDACTYFFGHSLSNTDGDIIRNIYYNSKKIVVFYLNKSDKTDYEQKIINLIDSLGKNNVIQGMYSGRIDFSPIE